MQYTVPLGTQPGRVGVSLPGSLNAPDVYYILNIPCLCSSMMYWNCTLCYCLHRYLKCPGSLQYRQWPESVQRVLN